MNAISCRLLTYRGHVRLGDGHSAGLVAGKRDIELAVVWQVECLADGLGKLFITVRAGLDLEAVGAIVEVDIHDRRRVGTAFGRQCRLPVRQLLVAELAVRLPPARFRV